MKELCCVLNCVFLFLHKRGLTPSSCARCSNDWNKILQQNVKKSWLRKVEDQWAVKVVGIFIGNDNNLSRATKHSKART